VPRHRTANLEESLVFRFCPRLFLRISGSWTPAVCRSPTIASSNVSERRNAIVRNSSQSNFLATRGSAKRSRRRGMRARAHRRVSPVTNDPLGLRFRVTLNLLFRCEKLNKYNISAIYGISLPTVRISVRLFPAVHIKMIHFLLSRLTRLPFLVRFQSKYLEYCPIERF